MRDLLTEQGLDCLLEPGSHACRRQFGDVVLLGMIEQWLDNPKLVPEQEVWKTTIDGKMDRTTR